MGNTMAAFLILVFVLFLHPVGGDGDIFHHLATGKYILAHHALPYFDTFTFTAAGKPWVAYAWGSGVIMQVLFQTFGPIGLSILAAAVAALTAFLLIRLLQSYNLGRVPVYITTGLTIALLSTRFPDRPEIFLYPILLALLLIERERKERSFLIFFIPVLIALLSFLYGSSVFLALLLILFFALREIVRDNGIRKGNYLLYLLSASKIG